MPSFALPLALSGLRASTKQYLVMDAGKAILNLNAEYLRATGDWIGASDPNNGWVDDNGDLVYPQPLGATRGGTNMALGKTERQVEADGRRTRIKGLVRVDMIEPFLDLELLEMGSRLQLSLAIASSIRADHPRYSEYTPDLLVNDGDYFGNVAVLATVSGESDPMIYLLDNVRVDEVADFPLRDKSEQTVKVKLYGHALLTAPTTIPAHFFVPITYAS